MNRIKTLREEFGYTQQDLANKLNSSKSVIGLYENETRKPSLEILLKLSEVFNCSIDYLLGKTNIRNYDKDEQEFRFAYHKEMEGLTDEEIADALRFYKEMKKKYSK
nr:MAG TPA: helix-turn-helix domain protein [Bacteriophage sp.]